MMKICKGGFRTLVGRDLAPRVFRTTLTDILTFLVVEPIDAAMPAFNCKRSADKLILSLLWPSFGTLKQKGDLLFCHHTIISSSRVSIHRHQQRSDPPAFPEQDVIGTHRR